MKKTLLKLLLLCAVFLVNNQLQAQTNNSKDSTSVSSDDEDDEDDEEMQAVIKEKERLAKLMAADSTKKALKAARNSNNSSSEITFRNNWALSIGAGTLGFGGTINKKISNHFTVNLGYYKGNLNQSAETTFGKDKVSIDANIKVGAALLLLDYHPSLNSSFRFTFGAAYNFNNYDVDITPKGDQSYGLIVYNSDQVGKINFDIKGANVAPYLGIGFGNAVPKRRIGVGLDLGAFYHGNPQTKLSATGSFEPSNNAENTATLQRAFEGNNVYFFVNLKLNIKLIK